LLESISGRLMQTLDWPPFAPMLMAFSTDDKQFALVDQGEGYGKNLGVWDLTSGKLIHAFATGAATGMPSNLAFSHDGRLLALGRPFLRVWDLASEKQLDVGFVGHASGIESMAFLGQSQMVATSGDTDETVRVWDARTGRQKVLIPTGRVPRGLAVSPDGKLIAAVAGTWGYSDKPASVHMWDSSTGKPLREISGLASSDTPIQLCFSADAKRLIGTCNDTRIRIWDVENGKRLSENDMQFFMPRINGLPRAGVTERKATNLARPSTIYVLYGVAFSPDARTLLASSDGVFHVLSVETGKELRRFGSGVQDGDVAIISPDGKLALYDTWDTAANTTAGSGARAPMQRSLHLWNLAEGKEVWRMPSPVATTGPICFSADGKRFAVSGRNLPWEVRVYDVATRDFVRGFKADSFPCCLKFSPDGRLFVAGMADGSAVTWDLSQASAGGQD
jgi:WD40 repeat protein